MRPAADDAADLALVAQSPVNAMVTARHDVDRLAWARTIHDRSTRLKVHSWPCAVTVFPPGPHAVGGWEVDDWLDQAAGGTLFIDRVGDLSPEA